MWGPRPSFEILRDQMSLESPFGQSSPASAALPAADGNPGLGVGDETSGSSSTPSHQQLENRHPGPCGCAPAKALSTGDARHPGAMMLDAEGQQPRSLSSPPGRCLADQTEKATRSSWTRSGLRAWNTSRSSRRARRQSSTSPSPRPSTSTGSPRKRELTILIRTRGQVQRAP